MMPGTTNWVSKVRRSSTDFDSEFAEKRRLTVLALLARDLSVHTTEVPMPDLGFHLMIRSDDDRVFAPSTALRRELARSVYRVAVGYPLASFGAADNHLHVELLADRATAGRFAHALMCSLHWALDLPVEFAPVRYKPLADQGHKLATLHYTLGQRNHHGVQSDPFMDACSLPELFGMRLVPTATISVVREHFPRLQRGDLVRHLGMDTLLPAGDEHVELLLELGRHDLLRDAAAGAVAAPSLDGQRSEVVAARTALVHVLRSCSRPALIGEVVRRRSSQVRHLARCTPADPLVRAVRLQIYQRLWLMEHQPELVELTPKRLPGCGREFVPSSRGPA
jgi:hypothetical protein